MRQRQKSAAEGLALALSAQGKIKPISPRAADAADGRGPKSQSSSKKGVGFSRLVVIMFALAVGVGCGVVLARPDLRTYLLGSDILLPWQSPTVLESLNSPLNLGPSPVSDTSPAAFFSGDNGSEDPSGVSSGAELEQDQPSRRYKDRDVDQQDASEGAQSDNPEQAEQQTQQMAKDKATEEQARKDKATEEQARKDKAELEARAKQAKKEKQKQAREQREAKRIKAVQREARRVQEQEERRDNAEPQSHDPPEDQSGENQPEKQPEVPPINSADDPTSAKPVGIFTEPPPDTQPHTQPHTNMQLHTLPKQPDTIPPNTTPDANPDPKRGTTSGTTADTAAETTADTAADTTAGTASDTASDTSDTVSDTTSTTTAANPDTTPLSPLDQGARSEATEMLSFRNQLQSPVALFSLHGGQGGTRRKRKRQAFVVVIEAGEVHELPFQPGQRYRARSDVLSGGEQLFTVTEAVREYYIVNKEETQEKSDGREPQEEKQELEKTPARQKQFVTFENARSRPVALAWLHQRTGQETHLFDLQAGQRHPQNTFVGHQFVARDIAGTNADNVFKHLFVIVASQTKYVVSEALDNEERGNSLMKPPLELADPSAKQANKQPQATERRSSLEKISVAFVNDLTTAVDIFWIDEKAGIETRLYTMEPTTRKVERTIVGHKFRVAGGAGQLSYERIVTVLTGVVSYHFNTYHPRALDASSRSLTKAARATSVSHHSPIILENARLLFCLPASFDALHWIKLFAKLEGRSNWVTLNPRLSRVSGLQHLNSVPRSRADKLVSSFSVVVYVQCPLERFLMAYLEHCRYPKRSMQCLKPGVTFRHSFESFVEAAAKETLSTLRPAFQGQAAQCDLTTGLGPPDIVITDMDASARRYFESAPSTELLQHSTAAEWRRANAQTSQLNANPWPSVSNVPAEFFRGGLPFSLLNAFYTPQLAQAIQHLYREDYLTFHLATAPWVARLDAASKGLHAGFKITDDSE